MRKTLPCLKRSWMFTATWSRQQTGTVSGGARVRGWHGWARDRKPRSSSHHGFRRAMEHGARGRRGALGCGWGPTCYPPPDAGWAARPRGSACCPRRVLRCLGQRTCQVPARDCATPACTSGCPPLARTGGPASGDSPTCLEPDRVGRAKGLPPGRRSPGPGTHAGGADRRR